MENKDEIYIKKCMLYHLDDIMTVTVIYFNDILLDEKYKT